MNRNDVVEKNMLKKLHIPWQRRYDVLRFQHDEVRSKQIAVSSREPQPRDFTLTFDLVR